MPHTVGEVGKAFPARGTEMVQVAAPFFKGVGRLFFDIGKGPSLPLPQENFRKVGDDVGGVAGVGQGGRVSTPTQGGGKDEIRGAGVEPGGP